MVNFSSWAKGFLPTLEGRLSDDFITDNLTPDKMKKSRSLNCSETLVEFVVFHCRDSVSSALSLPSSDKRRDWCVCDAGRGGY